MIRTPHTSQVHWLQVYSVRATMHPHSPRHHHLGVLRHSFEFAPTQQAHPRYANDYKLEWCCTSYVNSRAEFCSCPYLRAPGEFEQGELAAGFHSCRGANIKMIHVVVSVMIKMIQAWRHSSCCPSARHVQRPMASEHSANT